MNSRKLSLKRDTLAELSTVELGVVVGGTHGCATDDCTHLIGDVKSLECETLPDPYCLTLFGPRCIH